MSVAMSITAHSLKDDVLLEPWVQPAATESLQECAMCCLSQRIVCMAVLDQKVQIKEGY